MSERRRLLARVARPPRWLAALLFAVIAAAPLLLTSGGPLRRLLLGY